MGKPVASFLIPKASVAAPHESELVIRRSRFLTLSAHTPGLSAGRQFVESLRQRFPDATHHCFACIGAEPGDMGHAQASDDGEPHGTAGRPMLQILAHADIGEICTVVVRWFGGVKLGTGGLVRAYQESVRTNLDSLPLEERKECLLYDLDVEYQYADACSRLLKKSEASILSSTYAASMQCSFLLPKEQEPLFLATFATITNGKGTCAVRSRGENADEFE
ncbi:MAG: YigZ family protein [Desulfovibrio sp.]|nr:YigZ family protein [Desulfovibrio sp.]